MTFAALSIAPPAAPDVPPASTPAGTPVKTPLMHQVATFGYAETYTNKFTNITYNEGASGSGTYVANGNGVIFTILEKSSEKVQEFVGAGIVDGVMTVTYSGPDGSGTGKLRR